MDSVLWDFKKSVTITKILCFCFVMSVQLGILKVWTNLRARDLNHLNIYLFTCLVDSTCNGVSDGAIAGIFTLILFIENLWLSQIGD